MITRKKINMLVFSLDLELNPSLKNPFYKIIEVGGVIGNLDDGSIVEEFSFLVNPYEPLNTCEIQPLCNITKLTGITQEMIDKEGMDLHEVYYKLCDLRKKYVDLGFKIHRNPVTWGSDSLDLKEQLEVDYGMRFKSSRDPQADNFLFGYRWLDAKTIFQSIRLAKGESTQAGLAKALTKYQINFKGKKHRAKDDALNTFLLYKKMIDDLRKL